MKLTLCRRYVRDSDTRLRQSLETMLRLLHTDTPEPEKTGAGSLNGAKGEQSWRQCFHGRWLPFKLKKRKR